MPPPIKLAAIDAGSNAIRLVIARIESSSRLRILEAERYPLRLGRCVFTDHQFDKQTIEKAVKAFRHFESLLHWHGVKKYRAVATSATRVARNRGSLIGRIYKASGIRLEIIDEAEEARLVRCAVQTSPAGKLRPRWIADLGGGSLEISCLRPNPAPQSVGLPIGTVRIIEKFGIQGAMGPEQVRLVTSYIRSRFRRHPLRSASPSESPVIACGGNAEALALLAPGVPQNGIPTIDLRALRRKLRQLTALDLKDRMRVFHLRKDRAEVIGVAAIVFTTLGRWWNLEQFLVPSVGVKEGVLIGLLQSLSERKKQGDNAAHAEFLLAAARLYATRLSWDSRHGEKVRQLAASLFDQLRPVHKLPAQLRLTLEVAALLHDIGDVVGHPLHDRHGEYLSRHAMIPGLEASRRKMIACLIRHHSDSEPQASDKLFPSFSRKEQAQIRKLLTILRIADALDSERTQAVDCVRVRLSGRSVCFSLKVRRPSDFVLYKARTRAALFEAAFHRTAEFKLSR